MVGQLVQVSSKFVWTIENFSELTDKAVQHSDVFRADGYEWYVVVYMHYFRVIATLAFYVLEFFFSLCFLLLVFTITLFL